MPNIDQAWIAGLKQMLVEQVEGTADWRARKADEYPHDAERNIAASADLIALADSLRSIADDDPLWLAYACVASGDDDGAPLLLSERESEVLGGIGFRQAKPDGRGFLRELVQVAEPEAAS